RTAKALDAIVDGGLEPESISLSSPPGGTPAGAVACFHYRTLLGIPDIDRRPCTEEPAVRADDRAKRSHRGAGTGPGRPDARFQRRRTGAGAASGQPDRGGDPVAR